MILLLYFWLFYWLLVMNHICLLCLVSMVFIEENLLVNDMFGIRKLLTSLYFHLPWGAS